MSAAFNAKIVMKNTTKMSLNERFTAYRAETQTLANSYRQKMAVQRQANTANLRLAQQMANRPTVLAALRLKKRSVQQRLGRNTTAMGGSNIQSRLTLNRNTAGNSIRGRLGPLRGRRGGGPRNTTGFRSGASSGFRAGSSPSFRAGTSPMLKARLGVAQNNFSFRRQQQPMTPFRNRRGGGGFNFNRGPQRFNNSTRGRGVGRGGRRFRGRGTNRSNTGKQPTKQELDNQLDAYMAETKPAGHYM